MRDERAATDVDSLTRMSPRVAGILQAAGAAGQSLVPIGPDSAIGLREASAGWQLLAWGPAQTVERMGLTGDGAELEHGVLLTCPASHDNAVAVRRLVPWLSPRPIGQKMSVGLGDRLGMATPGHVQALRRSPGVTPVLAQQSARELFRTGRSYADVLDAATFGALASGWRDGYGSDADHSKTLVELDHAAAAGFTMFTADPIDLVPDLPADAPWMTLRPIFEQIPWSDLEDDEGSFASRYADDLDLGTTFLPISREALRSAAARFGHAVVKTVAMYRHIVGILNGRDFEFEIAVDETNYPTTAVDHLYLATELHRLGVRLTSLAPRFVGRFEKGIDYLGDPALLATDVRMHASIAQYFGWYRLSVHSGSDKFSVYRALANETRRCMHLKTSGTSYLVALRTIGETEPELLDQAWRLARETYAQGRSSYQVSARDPSTVAPSELSSSELGGLFEDPNAREILHVTFGAVLRHRSDGGNLVGGRSLAPAFGRELRAAVWAHRATYWARLADHIDRHLQPFDAGPIS
jgi:tagaturonate epimerase